MDEITKLVNILLISGHATISSTNELKDNFSVLDRVLVVSPDDGTVLRANVDYNHMRVWLSIKDGTRIGGTGQSEIRFDASLYWDAYPTGPVPAMSTSASMKASPRLLCEELLIIPLIISSLKRLRTGMMKLVLGYLTDRRR